MNAIKAFNFNDVSTQVEYLHQIEGYRISLENQTHPGIIRLGVKCCESFINCRYINKNFYKFYIKNGVNLLLGLFWEKW